MAGRRQVDDLERRLPDPYIKTYVNNRPGHKVTRVLNAAIAYTADLEEDSTVKATHLRQLERATQQKDLDLRAQEEETKKVEEELAKAKAGCKRQNDQLRSLLRTIPSKLLNQYTSAGQMPGDALCNYLFELKARAGLLAKEPVLFDEKDYIGDGDEDAEDEAAGKPKGDDDKGIVKRRGDVIVISDESEHYSRSAGGPTGYNRGGGESEGYMRTGYESEGLF
ncbi:MAG: hypothetical protein M1837_002014 [Sclerophora amabilis]|nr:MAG: hypothetical protein M1837_002014 [Sclerophora amabilis]